MENAFKLHLEDAKGATHIFDFDQNRVVVGRDPSSDLVIDDVEISRRHLVITREKNGIYFDDKNSTNGTFVDGKQIKKKTEFKNGDQLVLGQNHTLRLEVLEPQTVIEEPAVTDAVHTFEPPADAEKMMEEIESEPAIEASQEGQQRAEITNEEIRPVKANLPKAEKKVKPAGKERPKWVVILAAALIFIIVFCVIPLIVIEATNQWCDLFAGFFNSLSPNVCP